MIKYDTVKIKIANNQVKYYKELGYQAKKGIYLEVSIYDLKRGSTVKICRVCDDCGDEKMVERFVFGNEIGTYHSCISCASKKRCGENSPSWKGGYKTKCENCDNLTSKPEYALCRECSDKVRGGENHYKWYEDRNDVAKRSGSQMEKWGNAVKLRDGNKCIICASNDKPLEAHHLVGFSTDKTLGYDISNGVCLCNECHREFHIKYGYGQNTAEQFEEFSLGGE